jgi:hypothetical protein
MEGITEVMLRLLQLPPQEQEAWGHMLIAMVAVSQAEDEDRESN